MAFDIKTVMSLWLLVSVISALTVVSMYFRYRDRFQGIAFWALHMGLYSAGLLLLTLRGAIPDVFSVLLANFLLVLSLFFLLTGMERFVGRSGRHFHNYALIAAYSLCFWYFFDVRPDMTLRTVLTSLTASLLFGQVSFLLLIRTPSNLRDVTGASAFVTASYAVLSLARALLLLFSPLETNEFFEAGGLTSVALLCYVGLSVCWLVALILMIPRRLLDDVSVQEEKFAKIFRSSPSAIMLSRETDGRIFDVNGGFLEMTGYAFEEIVGKTLFETKLWGDDREYADIFSVLSRDKGARGIESVFRRKTGESISVLFSADVIVIDGEQCILSTFSDITEQSRLRRQLHEMATHDPLTGLPNRRLFDERAADAFARAMRHNRKLAIMSFDIDDFKHINDTNGHAVGDEVLRQAAVRLNDALRATDTVARLGGDEFVALIEEIRGRSDASSVAFKLLELFRRPFAVGGKEIRIRVSIGVALYPENGETLEVLLKKSDDALYRAKEMGRDTWQMAAD